MGKQSGLDISRLIIFGDSLSDSGNMDKRRILGLFPIPGTGLDKSGDGRFADGLVWPGFLALYWADAIFKRAIKDDAEREKLWNDFIEGLCQPENNVNILNHNIIRNYAEGGATAATYSILSSLQDDLDDLDLDKLLDILKLLEFSVMHPEILLADLIDSIKALGAQGLVINLAIERHQFLQNEAEFFKDKTVEQRTQLKNESLVTTWAGANDFITVNKKPTKAEADKAIAAIQYHLLTLEQNGYSQFIIFNLPDLTKTPFYQKQLEHHDISPEALEEIQEVIQYFNAQLIKISTNTSSQLMIYDIYNRFDMIYENASDYGFDVSKLKSPLSDDPEWTPEIGISPADTSGYLYWNDVHPTSRVQGLITQMFIDEIIEQEIYCLNDHLTAITEESQKANDDHNVSCFGSLQHNLHRFFSGLRHGLQACVARQEADKQPTALIPANNKQSIASFAQIRAEYPEQSSKQFTDEVIIVDSDNDEQVSQKPSFF